MGVQECHFISPHHKSNGIAESAVIVTKSLFKKGFWDERDPWLALLECRNTPLETIGSNPAQRLNVSKNEDTHANSLNSTSTRCHGRCGGSYQAKKAESKELSWLNSKAVATTWSWSRGQSSTTIKKQELASRNSYQATVQQVLPGEDWQWNHSSQQAVSQTTETVSSKSWSANLTQSYKACWSTCSHSVYQNVSQHVGDPAPDPITDLVTDHLPDHLPDPVPDLVLDSVPVKCRRTRISKLSL